jgi:protein-tyrosine sulfotransferase
VDYRVNLLTIINPSGAKPMNANHELREHPIFICGHPKAGTSLLRAVFDSHPQLIVYPEETIFFRRFLPQAQDLDRQQQLALAEKLLIHIFKWNRENPDPSQTGYPDRDYSAISFESVRQAMQQIAENRWQHAGDTLSAAVLAYGQVSEQITSATRCWVEKSPYNEYYAAQIFTWWPAARCIHILRDPRDNYVSYQRKHASWSAEFFAANWSRSTRTGMDNQQRFGAQRYLILRYEDLAQSPETSLRKMVDFLGVDWDASLTAPTRAGEQWQGNSMFADQFQSISAAAVARWKEKLSPEDAAVIELLAHPLMQTWQYLPSAAPTLKARWRAMIWPLRRRLSRFILE